MTHTTKYNVIMSGEIRVNFEPDLIANNFAKLFKIDPQKAASIIGSRRIIKKDLDLKTAELYSQKLKDIGLEIILEPQEQISGPSISEGKPQDLALLPVEKKEKEQQDSEGTKKPTIENGIICPKCQLEQKVSEKCINCGVFFHKIESMHSQNDPVPPTTQSPHVRYDTEIAESPNSLKIYFLPIIVAISGTFLWMVIALTTDYELGLIAWLIGGAVGYSAISVGIRGSTPAMNCAILALLSILCGKYLVISGLQSNLIDRNDSDIDSELKAAYQENLNIAKEFKRTVKNDESLRNFLITYDMTDYSDPESITAEEIAIFKKLVQPMIETLASNPPPYEEWKKDSLRKFENYSTLDLVRENLGITDMLFLILGVGTAFRIVYTES